MTIVRNWIVPQIEPRATTATQPPFITTVNLPNATAGSTYSFTMTAAGGVPPYAWSITSGPPWLTIGASTGILSGTPPGAETDTVLIKVTDTINAPTAPTGFTLTVNPSQGAGVWFGAQLPTLPQQFTTVSAPPAPANTNRGSYYTPGVGGDAALTVQGALNAAAAATGTKGDVIVLQAGTTYTTASAPYLLPARSGSGWIYVISSNAPDIGGTGLPAAGTRIGRADIVNMGSLRKTNNAVALVSRLGVPGVSFYRFVGIDFQLDDNSTTGGNVIEMSESDTSSTTLANNITFDRCYVAGAPISGITTGITLDGNFMEVTECRIERCYQQTNGDAHCVFMLNSTGPYKIHNNWMNASGETTFTGGGSVLLPSPAMPADITITNNHYYKAFVQVVASFTQGSPNMVVSSITSGGELIPVLKVFSAAGILNTNPVPQIIQQLSGTPGGVGTYQLNQNALAPGSNVGTTALSFLDKNMVEFKMGQRILLDSNYFENAFGGGQDRSAFVLTSIDQNGANPWSVIADITVTNNIFTNCFQGGMQFKLQDSSAGAHPTQPGHRFLIRNNIFMLSKPGNPNSSTTTSIAEITSNLPPSGNSNGQGGDLIFDHNTFVAPIGPNGMNTLFFMGTIANPTMQLNNLVWSNNIWDQSQNGITLGGSPSSNPNKYALCVPTQVSNPAFANNITTGYFDSSIPAGNFAPANVAAVGYTNYGSVLSATGYQLANTSQFARKGVSGLGLAFNATGAPDGTDIGCDITNFPVSFNDPLQQVFNISNFTGNPNITTSGSTTVGTAINLIPSGSGHAGGGAWWNPQLDISGGFKTVFTFSMTGMTVPTTAGLTFCVQNTSATNNPINHGNHFSNNANSCGYGCGVNQTPALMSVAVKFDADGFGMRGYDSGASPGTTGFYVNGGYLADNMSPFNDLKAYGINFYTGNVFQATVVYDGVFITWVLTDTVTGATCRHVAAVNIPNSTGTNINWVGFTAGTVSSAAIQVLSWQFFTGTGISLAKPTISPVPGQYSSGQAITLAPAPGAPGASIFYTTNGLLPTTASTPYTAPFTISANTIVQAIAVQSGYRDSNVATALYQIGSSNLVNLPNGFSSGDGMVINGYAFRSGSAIQLTDTLFNNESASAFWGAPLDITAFVTTFNVTFTSAAGNGLTFCLQAPGPAYVTSQPTVVQAPGGPDIFAFSGIEMGQGPDTGPLAGPATFGISRSVIVALDLFTVPNSVGVYTGGVTPTGSQTVMTGINLASGHPMSVTLTYSGTTLTFSITDTVTTTNYTQNFTVNIQNNVGGNIAYAGFTAGTGGATANIVVNSWTWAV